MADSLRRCPLLPAESRTISLLSPIDAASKLNEWFGFDIFRGISQDDRIYVHRMFHRRHLFTHLGGRVDQEYLDNSGDTTVRLYEVVRVSSKQVRRLLK